MMTLNAKIICKIRNEYGDAFYLLDSNQFKRNYLELKAAFSTIYPHFNIAYSYKTNYIPKLCKIVNDLDGYAEVVSEMELELALRCGVKPEKVIWNGPIKEIGKIKELLIAGGTVNIDSLEEAKYINNIVAEVDNIINIGIRCNYDVGDGVISRFGLDINGNDFKKTLDIVINSPSIHLVSFQCHFAKRQIEYWPARIKGMVELIDSIGIIPDRIDIGGGIFGKMEDSLKSQFSSKVPDYSEYAEIAATAFSTYFKDKNIKPELLIEPGSAIVSDCLKFVGTVKTIKNIRGKYIATILGSQKNISMTEVNPPIEVIHAGEAVEKYENLDLVGFTCIEGDILYKNYNGLMARGDAIVISNCGSYSLVMKPPFILPNFPVLEICEDKIEVIKQGETFEDIFHTFNF